MHDFLHGQVEKTSATGVTTAQVMNIRRSDIQRENRDVSRCQPDREEQQPAKDHVRDRRYAFRSQLRVSPRARLTRNQTQYGDDEMAWEDRLNAMAEKYDRRIQGGYGDDGRQHRLIPANTAMRNLCLIDRRVIGYPFARGDGIRDARCCKMRQKSVHIISLIHRIRAYLSAKCLNRLRQC